MRPLSSSPALSPLSQPWSHGSLSAPSSLRMPIKWRRIADRGKNTAGLPLCLPLSLLNGPCANFKTEGVHTGVGERAFFLQCSGTQGRTCTDILARTPPPRCGACVACPGEGFQYLFTIPVSRFFLSIQHCQTGKKKQNKQNNSRLHGIRPQKQHEGRQSSDGTAAFNC